jgi:hypothetical protein
MPLYLQWLACSVLTGHSRDALRRLWVSIRQLLVVQMVKEGLTTHWSMLLNASVAACCSVSKQCHRPAVQGMCF